MQAAARSYRLNQTHAHCKVIYLFAEGTMEQTAVQLMSRKQRAAKLLTGDIGLTGLDALTEGEGGFEQALLNAIGRDETLLDSTELFKAEAKVSEIDAEDAAYWAVEEMDVREPELAEMEISIPAADAPVKFSSDPAVPVRDAILSYLDTVRLIVDEQRWAALQTELLDRLAADQDHLCEWLRDNRIVFPGCEQEVAERLTALMRGEATPAPALHLVEPAPPVRKQRHEVLPFRRSEPPERIALDEAPVEQMALF
jgi:hypothetical protein